MSDTSFIEFALLHGLLVATVCGSIGMNYRKNEVFNLGLAGLTYLGSSISLILTEIMQINLYWSIPLCIFFGSLLNVGLNYGYILIRKNNSNRELMLGATVSTCLGLIVFSDLGYSLIKNVVNPFVIGVAQDFTLFNLAGVFILGPVVFLFSLLLQFILNPVVDDRESNPFDKWDLLIYSLAGSFACLIGVFYPLWDNVISPSVLVQVIIAGSLIGGLDKKLNPYIGGFLSGFLWMFLPLQSFFFGGLAMMYNQALPVALGVSAILFFPRGLVGKLRSIIEYEY